MRGKMDKLKKLMSKCKCGVYISVNEHRDYYETVEQRLGDNNLLNDCYSETPKDVLKKMIETNTMVQLQFYPDTPIGFYTIYHYDLNMALDEALGALDEGGNDG